MATMFDFAKPALEAAGLQIGASWGETKSSTLRAAKAQLARRDIRPETVARWNHRAYMVAADMGRDARIAPRVTAVHRNR